MANQFGSFGEERVQKIAAEIARRTKARKDYVAPREKLDVEANEKGLQLVLKNGSEHRLALRRSSLHQLAGTLDVPTRYLDSLMERGHRDLAAANLSELLRAEATTAKGEPRKHLIRQLDGEVDGFLSDKFKGFSNDTALAVVLEEAEKLHAEVWDLRLTDTHFRVNLIAPGLRGRVQHAMVADAPGHGWARGLAEDYHSAAFSMENSENGHGRFKGDISLWREACSNYAIIEKAIARIHLGARLEEGEQAIVSDETRELEDAAFASKLRDAIRAAFDPVRFQKLMDSISATTARGLGETSGVEAVDAAVKLFGLPQERKEAILEAFLQGGMKSQFGLAQALTAQANATFARDLDDAQLTAFEQAGGSVLALGAGGWKSFVAGAHRAPVEEAEEKVVAVYRK